MPTSFRPIGLVLVFALLVAPASSLDSLPQSKVGGTRMSTPAAAAAATASAGGGAAAAGAASGSEGGDTTGHCRSRDVWSFNTAMSQGIKDGELNFKGAIGMLDAMREEGISPNAGTYGSIMDAAMLGGGEDRQTSLDALDLLDSMPKECRSNHVSTHKHAYHILSQMRTLTYTPPVCFLCIPGSPCRCHHPARYHVLLFSVPPTSQHPNIPQHSQILLTS
jgi:hypothetical protein